jgi:hypothetical protein
MQRFLSLALLMGALLMSMSADAFILLMPTGGAVAPPCFTAPAADGSSTTFVAPFTVGATTFSAPFSLCP